MNLFTKGIAVLSVVLLGTTLTGCNTIRGLGRDIERGGAGIQNISEQAQQEMRR